MTAIDNVAAARSSKPPETVRAMTRTVLLLRTKASSSITPAKSGVQVLMKASRSGFTVSACVVHMPCGNLS